MAPPPPPPNHDAEARAAAAEARAANLYSGAQLLLAAIVRRDRTIVELQRTVERLLAGEGGGL